MIDIDGHGLLISSIGNPGTLLQSNHLNTSVAFLLGAGRRPSQGFASVFCFYFWCSEFPVRLQSLNLD